jgi:hypothetical protein
MFREHLVDQRLVADLSSPRFFAEALEDVRVHANRVQLTCRSSERLSFQLARLVLMMRIASPSPDLLTVSARPTTGPGAGSRGRAADAQVPPRHFRRIRLLNQVNHFGRVSLRITFRCVAANAQTSRATPERSLQIRPGFRSICTAYA